MVEGLFVERGRMLVVADVAVCSPGQQPGILFIGRKEGSFAEMDETQVMATATSLLCSIKIRDHVDGF